MTKQNTTATQSLKKRAGSRSGTDAAGCKGSSRKPAPKKQPRRKSRPLEEQVTTPVHSASPEKGATKQDQLASLLLRDEGATIAQMMNATGWLPHTVRAALTGLKKKGYGVDSDKVDGVRTYRATVPQ